MIVLNCMMVVMVQSRENESCCLVVCFVHFFFVFRLILFLRDYLSGSNRKEKRRQSSATPSPFLIISVLRNHFHVPIWLTHHCFENARVWFSDAILITVSLF